MSQLILHRGARPVERAELDQVEAPPPTGTWFPLRHSQVLSTVEETNCWWAAALRPDPIRPVPQDGHHDARATVS